MPPPSATTQSPVRRVLVIGARGMLGRAWCELLTSRGIDHDGRDLPEFDLLDARAVRRALAGGAYSHAVNAAGWTDVDGAERDEAGAMRLNADGVALLADACADARVHLTHFSTDYVYDGHSDRPYTIDAPRFPLNAYGRSKLAGERALEAARGDWTLVRTSWLYAPWGRNFVLTMLTLLDGRDDVRVVADQRGRPTSARHLAASTLTLVEGGHRGIWHVTDGGECSWHEFAVAIAGCCGAARTVRPCTSDQFPRPARRPHSSVLDLSRTEAELGPMPHWRHNLAEAIAEIRAVRHATEPAGGPA